MISAAECRQHIEPHLETQTICDHRLHCPPCPPMAFWNRAGVGCFWLTYDPQKQFPSLEVRLTMSCSALWAVDLGWSDQDTFQAGTFGGFPTSPFASGAQLEFNFHSFSLEEVRIFRHQHQEVGQIHPIRLPCSQ